MDIDLDAAVNEWRDDMTDCGRRVAKTARLPSFLSAPSGCIHHGNEPKVQTYSPANFGWHVALSSGAAVRLISSQCHPLRSPVETMAQNQELKTFIVWAPDSTSAGTLDRRLAVRPSHLDNIHRLTKGGIIREHRMAALTKNRRLMEA